MTRRLSTSEAMQIPAICLRQQAMMRKMVEASSGACNTGKPLTTRAQEALMATPIQDLPGEIWKPVVGFEGLYEVSDHGRVKSLGRRVRHPSARSGWCLITDTLMSPMTMNRGHLKVRVGAPGVPHKGRYVHHLVLEAFVGPRPAGQQCCHYDDNPTNNRVGNLRWDTQQANVADAKRNGKFRKPRGEEQAAAKLTDKIVLAIRARYKPHCHINGRRALAREFGVNRSTIDRVLAKQSWRHV